MLKAFEIQQKHFADEKRRREERNENILRTLERIDYQASSLAAKTERLRALKVRSCGMKNVLFWLLGETFSSLNFNSSSHSEAVREILDESLAPAAPPGILDTAKLHPGQPTSNRLRLEVRRVVLASAIGFRSPESRNVLPSAVLQCTPTRHHPLRTAPRQPSIHPQSIMFAISGFREFN